jgi:riboflavin kinase/FMN adenylyltransferase
LETFYEAKPGLLQQSAVALGFFDGVHPGHKVVISKAVDEARRIGATPAVITFKDHPRLLTRGASPLLLTVIEQRLELFAQLGVEATLALSFTEDLCRLTPRQYVQSVLLDAMGARSISVGYNHHFGRDREGNPELLKKFGSEMNFAVHVAPMVYVDGLEVSSSRVRECVLSGDVHAAQQLLTRPYAILGEVVQGEGRGRKLGFPTANLSIYQFQCLPQRGVYMGIARLEDGSKLVSVINVGYRPTFKPMPDGGAGSDIAPANSGPDAPPTDMLVEVHILDFDKFIYGQKLFVEFLHYLRSEQKFDGVESLKRQIDLDCRKARDLGDQKLTASPEVIKQ